MPVIEGSAKYGLITLLIKKEEDTKDQTIDCWRDSLLITSAFGYRKKEKEYSVILLINNNLLSELLRKLEDPGHTKWQTVGDSYNEVKKKYENIRGLVKFIKKLPLEILRQIKYPPIDQDSKFFADYFPEASPMGQLKFKKRGIDSNMSGGKGDLDPEPIFQDFTFTKNGKGAGFTLRLRNKNRYPEKVTVTTAYGTNIGNAFKNYDERDFIFGKDITIRVNHGKQISCSKNNVQYDICRFYKSKNALKEIEFFLQDKVNANGVFYRRIAENQDIVKNPTFIKVARQFFYNEKTKTLKKDITNPIQRLIKVWKQYERSFDMYRMPSKEVINRLLIKHDEFGIFINR